MDVVDIRSMVNGTSRYSRKISIKNVMTRSLG